MSGITRQERADAWKEIQANHPDLAKCLLALRKEFPEATMAPQAVRTFAQAWRSRAHE